MTAVELCQWTHHSTLTPATSRVFCAYDDTCSGDGETLLACGPCAAELRGLAGTDGYAGVEDEPLSGWAA